MLWSPTVSLLPTSHIASHLVVPEYLLCAMDCEAGMNQTWALSPPRPCVSRRIAIRCKERKTYFTDLNNQVSSLSNISNGGQGFVVAYVPHHATSKYCSTNLDILLHLQIGLESSTLTKYNFRIFLNIIKFNANLMLNLGYLCKFYVKLGQFVCKLSFCLSSSHFQHLHYKSSWHWNNFCCSI